ncbi:hypothetical protein BC830DRAFT_1078649 [Chytriomyces sp. MP71]|nr:hypothetical protein BC830DRAFT_1078649 [Chytriomyces sp. MP71]
MGLTQTKASKKQKQLFLKDLNNQLWNHLKNEFPAEKVVSFKKGQKSPLLKWLPSMSKFFHSIAILTQFDPIFSLFSFCEINCHLEYPILIIWETSGEHRTNSKINKYEMKRK